MVLENGFFVSMAKSMLHTRIHGVVTHELTFAMSGIVAAALVSSSARCTVFISILTASISTVLLKYTKRNNYIE